MNFQNKYLNYVLPTVIIIVVSLVYFFPILQGKTLAGGDIVSSVAWSKHVTDYTTDTGEDSYWNPAQFSGMPWGLLTLGAANNLLINIKQILGLYMDGPIDIFIRIGLIAYISLLVLRVNPWIALIISLLYSYNINYIILIEVGHWNKVIALSYFPLIISGFIHSLRKQWLLSLISIAVGTSLAILSNHIQMVYYLILALFVFSFIQVIYLVREKEFSTLSKASLIIITGALLGGLSNTSMLYSSYVFSTQTLRGETIIKQEQESPSSSSSADQTSGLDWDYAMAWSNEIPDLMSFFIPRAVGGSSSEEISGETSLGRIIARNSRPDSDGQYVAPLYFGNLPFTEGPYYIGSTILFLLILSFFYLPRSLALSLAGSIILILLISMGSNAAWINRLMFDYFPLFNKFRAPNSAVNLIPAFVLITVGLGLNQLFINSISKDLLKKILYSASIVLSLLFLYVTLYPLFENFLLSAESQYAPAIRSALSETRKQLLNKDAITSAVFVLITSLLFYIYDKGRIKHFWQLAGLFLLLSAVDIQRVNIRYLDADEFTDTLNFDRIFSPREVDKQIFDLEPNGRGYYRVFDLSVNTFNSAKEAYHHNLIGGYHPAKTRRYQDIIDYHLTKGSVNAFAMLNAKYIITRDGQLQVNRDALGNAWFVSDLVKVSNPLEEIEKISSIDPANQAIVLESEFEEILDLTLVGDSQGNIELTDYSPNQLVYRSSSETPQLAVFSEVFYDEEYAWEVFIDGEPSPNLFRVNYILRALPIPAGDHIIEFVFKPNPKFGSVSLASSSVIILLLMFLFYSNRKAFYSR